MEKSEQEAIDWGTEQYRGRKVGSRENCKKMKLLVDMAIKSTLTIYNKSENNETKKKD